MTDDRDREIAHLRAALGGLIRQTNGTADHSPEMLRSIMQSALGSARAALGDWHPPTPEERAASASGVVIHLQRLLEGIAAEVEGANSVRAHRVAKLAAEGIAAVRELHRSQAYDPTKSAARPAAAPASAPSRRGAETKPAAHPRQAPTPTAPKPTRR